MPEKGWAIVTVREETKELLMRISKAKGVSINDLIVSVLDEKRRRTVCSSGNRLGNEINRHRPESARANL